MVIDSATRPVPHTAHRFRLDLGYRTPFVISRADREALLDRLTLTAGGYKLVTAILEIGPLRPVPLEAHDQLSLYGALELWRQSAEAGRAPSLPQRLNELRYLLAR